jgi:hypothetical protein
MYLIVTGIIYSVTKVSDMHSHMKKNIKHSPTKRVIVELVEK